jgi:hypothetical protein
MTREIRNRVGSWCYGLEMPVNNSELNILCGVGDYCRKPKT